MYKCNFIKHKACTNNIKLNINKKEQKNIEMVLKIKCNTIPPQGYYDIKKETNA